MWLPIAGAQSYSVFWKAASAGDAEYRPLDAQLVRKYPDYYRADALGLSAGEYVIKVVPVASGAEQPEQAWVSPKLTVQAHSREGFAFSSQSTAGTGSGGYQDDGALAPVAQVLYVDKHTVNTVSLDVIIGEGGKTSRFVGLPAILGARGKAFDLRPLTIRVIGLVRDTDVMGLKDGGYLSLKGGSSTARTTNVTLEGWATTLPCTGSASSWPIPAILKFVTSA